MVFLKTIVFGLSYAYASTATFLGVWSWDFHDIIWLLWFSFATCATSYSFLLLVRTVKTARRTTAWNRWCTRIYFFYVIIVFFFNQLFQLSLVWIIIIINFTFSILSLFNLTLGLRRWTRTAATFTFVVIFNFDFALNYHILQITKTFSSFLV